MTDAALIYDRELPAAVASAASAALEGESPADRTVFLARLHRYWPELVTGLRPVYGEQTGELAARVAALATAQFSARSAGLRLLDLRRHVEPDWFQSSRMLGYAAYADRFAGDLGGVAERAGYLAELGVTYLHLLPLLEPRPWPNDGGYAVQDYRQVRSDLGTMADLEHLSDVLRDHGISLILDLVLNHVAAEHEWARRARAGEERYRRYFHVFDTREQPDAYERTLPEVFPDFAPGNFTFEPEMDAWVWTTFNTWQWDLNWQNPDVFCEFADLICFLANRGVECLRLDAIAFVWKRMGTNCQNQPEVHAITQALRAVAKITAPALLFKAEAIVGPNDLLPYLGTGAHAGKVSDLAYHNSLMVQIWSALATRDARLATVALRRFPPKPASTAWATYVRCHDDIGWAIDDADAATMGWNGFSHRAFLSDYYSGSFPGSPSRGLVFQENTATGDRRISGMAASLTGLEAALEAGDSREIEMAVRRTLLAHVLMLGFGGIPLLWMGDEVALLNDHGYASDDEHVDDNRWVHRPRMLWDVVDRRHTVGTVEHRMWQGIRDAVLARASLLAMHASIETQVFDPVNPAILAWGRDHPLQPVVCLFNVSEHHQWWPRAAVPLADPLYDALSRQPAPGDQSGVLLGPYEACWLVTGTATGTEPGRSSRG